MSSHQQKVNGEIQGTEKWRTQGWEAATVTNTYNAGFCSSGIEPCLLLSTETEYLFTPKFTEIKTKMPISLYFLLQFQVFWNTVITGI